MKYLYLTVSSIILAYLAIILFVYFYQRNLVYLPSENNYLNDKIDFKYEEIFLETDKKISYRLVGQDEADIKKNFVFFRSPIGKALVGKDTGEMVTVNTPSGERNFEILDVEYV